MSSRMQRCQAFCDAVLPHANRAFTLARDLTASDPDAEDIAQEALLRAWKYFDTFEAPSGLPWLEAIVNNTHKSWRSRRDRAAVQPLHPLAPVFESQLIRRLAVREAVARLPSELRTIFLSREIAGLSCAEVSARFGVPKRTLYARLRRARVEMREMLRDFR